MVVETTNIRADNTQIEPYIPKHEGMYVVQRYTPVSKGRIDLNVTVTSPEFTRPWIVKLKLTNDPKGKLVEAKCSDDNRWVYGKDGELVLTGPRRPAAGEGRAVILGRRALLLAAAGLAAPAPRRGAGRRRLRNLRTQAARRGRRARRGPADAAPAARRAEGAVAGRDLVGHHLARRLHALAVEARAVRRSRGPSARTCSR